MSAMADIILEPHIHAPRNTDYSAFRDLMLALSLTILAALAMEATTSAPIYDPAITVQDWKGNSGSLPPLH